MGEHPVIERRCGLAADGMERLFGGLSVGPIIETQWRIDQDHSQHGQFWTAKDASGLHWVADGTHRMAALPSRAFRFFMRGIEDRCTRLTYRYLRGLVPLSDGDVAINFGANIGEVAVVLESMGLTVHAIEPDPNVIAYLRANAQGRRIVVDHVAAWCRQEDVTLYLKSDNADSSLFNKADESVVIPGCPIDILAAHIDRVHLIIGDAEGAEPEVLEGARETLRRTSYVAVSGSAERCGERTIDACEAILTSAGFDIMHRDSDGFCMLLGKNRRIPDARYADCQS